jgi:hypothetical protein
MGRHATAAAKKEREEAEEQQEAAAAEGDASAQQDARPDMDAPSMPGGAPGAPGAVNLPVAPRVEEEGDRNREAKRYMIVDGPRHGNDPSKVRFYSQGYVASLPVGKIVTGVTHNLKELRDQGIKLEAMPDIIEEAQPGIPG